MVGFFTTNILSNEYDPFSMTIGPIYIMLHLLHRINYSLNTHKFENLTLFISNICVKVNSEEHL